SGETFVPKIGPIEEGVVQISDEGRFLPRVRAPSTCLYHGNSAFSATYRANHLNGSGESSSMAETAYTRPEETFGPTVMRFLRARALSTVALEQGLQRGRVQNHRRMAHPQRALHPQKPRAVLLGRCALAVVALKPDDPPAQHDLAGEPGMVTEVARAGLGGIEVAGQQQRQQPARTEALEPSVDERGRQLAALAERRIGDDRIGRLLQFRHLRGEEVDYFVLSAAVVDDVAGIDAGAA